MEEVHNGEGWLGGMRTMNNTHTLAMILGASAVERAIRLWLDDLAE